jgi:hypothetical protein
MTSSTTLAANQRPGQVDLEALKARQQGAWSSGNYAVVGTTLQIVGEDLCEALDVRSGQKVLDVAAGNGNVTLAAALRWPLNFSGCARAAARLASPIGRRGVSSGRSSKSSAVTCRRRPA